MSKRQEELGRILIVILFVVAFYGPIFILFRMETALGVGFIFGMFWLAVLCGATIWFLTDPDEEPEEENEDLTAE